MSGRSSVTKHEKDKSFFHRYYYELILLLLFGVLFYRGIGGIFAHELVHDYPFGYFAADEFAHLSVAEALKSQGHLLYMPAYLNSGYEKGLPHNTPGMAHWAVLFDHVAWPVELYHSLHLLVGILFVLLPFVFVSSLDLPRHVKLISLSFAPLLLRPHFVSVYLWGQMGVVMGVFFLYCFYLAFSRIGKKALFLGLILAGTFLVHFPEALFIVLFLIIYAIIEFIRERKGLLPGKLGYLYKNFKWLALTILIFVIVSSFYLVIFYHGNMLMYTQVDRPLITFGAPDEFLGLNVVKLTDFNLVFLALLLLGVISVFFMKNKTTTKIILLFTLLISFMHYFGFFHTAIYRAFQHRYFWPITLAPFVAIAAMLLFGWALSIAKVDSKSREKMKMAFSIIILLAVFTNLINQPVRYVGDVISKDQYEAIKYLERNSAESDKIVFLFGDRYEQSMRVMNRMYYATPIPVMRRILSKQASFNDYFTFGTDDSRCTNAVFDGWEIKQINKTRYHNMTFCDFDYYILDKDSENKDDAHVRNGLIFNKMFINSVGKHAFDIFYENNQTVVLKKTDDNCMKETYES